MVDFDKSDQVLRVSNLVYNFFHVSKNLIDLNLRNRQKQVGLNIFSKKNRCF